MPIVDNIEKKHFYRTIIDFKCKLKTFLFGKYFYFHIYVNFFPVSLNFPRKRHLKSVLGLSGVQFGL